MKHRIHSVVLACLITVTACGGSASTSTDPTSDTVPTAGSSTAETSAETTGTDATEAPSVVTTADSALTGATGAVCALATDEEISAIVGNDVTGIDLDATLCEYSLVAGAPAVGGTAVDVFQNAAFNDVCDLEFGLFGIKDAEQIEGVGQIAYWSGGTQTPQLLICTGSSFVAVTQYKPSAIADDEALARARAIADIVLERM